MNQRRNGQRALCLKVRRASADTLGPLKNEQKDVMSEKLGGLLDSDKSAKSSGDSVLCMPQSVK